MLPSEEKPQDVGIVSELATIQPDGVRKLLHASEFLHPMQKPDNPVEQTAGSRFARRTSEKQFHGDLEGTSVGEMLGLVTETKGSAAYVALEWATGKLDGRAGTFVLQHSATMTRGDGQLKITVVPDSATGELAGLSGSMMIKIEEGKHSYEFDYSLPAKQ
jgi:hypothetical protein